MKTSINLPRLRFFKVSLFLLLILVCVYFFLHSSFFKVDQIYVSGENRVPASQIIKLSGVIPGVNIFLLNEKDSARAVENHPLIRKAGIIRHLPRRIEIKVEERKIWALVPNGSSLVCIDPDGVCIDKVTELSMLNYPIVTLKHLPVHINLGQAVQPEGVSAIRQVWEALSVPQRKKISDYHYDSDKNEIVLYTTSGTEIKWGDRQRLKEKVDFLGQVLEIEKQMSERGDDALEYVDLRFKGQPVIKPIASEPSL